MFERTIVCKSCKGTKRDSFDGGSCLDCHNTGEQKMSFFAIWKYNRLVDKYGTEQEKVQRIT